MASTRGLTGDEPNVHSFQENPVFGVAAVRHSFEAACFRKERLCRVPMLCVCVCVCVCLRACLRARISLCPSPPCKVNQIATAGAMKLYSNFLWSSISVHEVIKGKLYSRKFPTFRSRTFCSAICNTSRVDQYVQNKDFIAWLMGVKMTFHVEGETQAGSFREYVA
jgi:hypothetical protein